MSKKGLVPIQSYIAETVEELEEKRNQAINRAALHLTDIVEAVAERAKSGDGQCARLIFEIAGLVRRPGLTVAMQNNNIQQRSEPVPTLKDILGPDFKPSV